MAERKAETTVEFLKDIGEPTAELRNLIMEQIDLDGLSSWHKLEARAESIEEFEKTAEW